jgi:hypothetical protein
MMTRSKIILLTLFFGGLIALWGADRAGVTTSLEARGKAARILPALIGKKPGDVRRIEIDGGETPIVLTRREDGRWELNKPVHARADSFKVDVLIATLKDLPKSDEAGTIRGSLSEYGLDSPSRVVRLFGTDAKNPLAELALGKTNQNQQFVRDLSRAGIDVVEHPRVSAVEQSASEWRQRALFTISSIDIEGIAFFESGREFRAKRVGANWQIELPAEAPGDEVKLEGLLADVTGLEVADGAKGYIDDNAKDLAKYGLDNPTLSLEVTSKRPAATTDATTKADGASQKLFVGNEVENHVERRYARLADGKDVVIIATGLLKKLSLEPKDWRSLRVANVELQQVSQIEVSAGGIDHLIKRAADGWRTVRPAEGKADEATVRRLLATFATTRAIQLGGPAEAPNVRLRTPSAEIRITQPGEKQGTTQVLDLKMVRNTQTQTVYARLGDDPTILFLPTNLIDTIPEGPLAFRDRTILTLREAFFDRVTVRRAGIAMNIASRDNPRDFASWAMTEPVKGGKVDAETVAKLVVLLANLRADTLITETPDDLKRFGLEPPDFTVTWSTVRDPSVLGKSDPAKTEAGNRLNRTLRIGGFASSGRKGTRFAQVTGVPMVFTLAPEAIDILQAELYDHKALSFRLERVAGLTLRWEDRALRFNRQPRAFSGPDDWKPDPNTETGGFDVSVLNPLLNLLSNLTTTRYVQYDGLMSADYGLFAPQLAVEVSFGRVERPQILRIGNNSPDGQRYATVEPARSGKVFLLPGNIWDAWAKGSRVDKGELPKNVFAP